MKSEPDVYSIDDLERDGVSMWEGVRNYQARNLLRDEISRGDLVLFYHSSAKTIGVAGVGRVARGGYPDPTQFDKQHKYFDAKSDPDNPRWFVVDVEHVETFGDVLELAQIKAEPRLSEMKVVQKGQRLSVQPVDKEHFRLVLKLAGARTRVR